MFRFTRKPSSGSHSQYLAKNYTLGSKWIRRARTRRCQCYGCILWPVYYCIVLYCNTDNVLYEFYVFTFEPSV